MADTASSLFPGRCRKRWRQYPATLDRCHLALLCKLPIGKNEDVLQKGCGRGSTCLGRIANSGSQPNPLALIDDGASGSPGSSTRFTRQFQRHDGPFGKLDQNRRVDSLDPFARLHDVGRGIERVCERGALYGFAFDHSQNAHVRGQIEPRFSLPAKGRTSRGCPTTNCCFRDRTGVEPRSILRTRTSSSKTSASSSTCLRHDQRC